MRAPNEAEQAAKQEARSLWERDRAALLIEQPFLAMLALALEIVPVVDARLPTASTDGRNVYVNPAYLRSLDHDGRVFLLAHEVWHCAFRHFLRRGEREPRLWNVATDHEVNAMLHEQGLKVPADAILFPMHRGHNAETVYEALLEGALEIKGRLQDVHPDDRPGGASPLDSGDGSRRGSDKADDEGSGKSEAPSWLPPSEVLDPDYVTGLSPEDFEEWPERVVSAAQQMARQQGELPAGIERFVDEIVRPGVPWRERLRQFVTSTFGGERRWLPPARRHVHQGLYLPSRRDEALQLALGIDTSGSTEGDLPLFLAELKALLASFGRCELRVLLCDAALHEVLTLSEDDLEHLERLRFPGGGGSDLRPVFDWLDAHDPPRALVFFTDGFAEVPSLAPAYPVLWALTAGGRAPCHWGEVLQMDEPR